MGDAMTPLLGFDASPGESVHDGALEQTAATAHSWQGAQRRQCASSGPRPGSRSPLLTAGIRSGRVHRRHTILFNRQLLVVLPAISLALGGCGLATVCPRSPFGRIDVACLANGLKTGDEVWVYTDSGQPTHGIYLRTTVQAGAPGLVLNTLTEHGYADSAVIDLSAIHRVSTPRITSRLSGAVLFGLIVGGVAAFWWFSMSMASMGS
jgi:hypothetical protein